MRTPETQSADYRDLAVAPVLSGEGSTDPQAKPGAAGARALTPWERAAPPPAPRRALDAIGQVLRTWREGRINERSIDFVAGRTQGWRVTGEHRDRALRPASSDASCAVCPVTANQRVLRLSLTCRVGDSAEGVVRLGPNASFSLVGLSDHGLCVRGFVNRYGFPEQIAMVEADDTGTVTLGFERGADQQWRLSSGGELRCDSRDHAEPIGVTLQGDVALERVAVTLQEVM
jgi:hypothetical protein